MWKRVLAAIAALVLGLVGVVLVIAYANRADERALAGMETVEVLVARETVPEGLTGADVADYVEAKKVPLAFVAEGALDDLRDVSDLVLTAELNPGEQLTNARFATPEETRARGTFQLPEEAKKLHQVTVPLSKPRALGGDIAPGDTVGVFMSFDVSEADGYVLGSDGRVRRQETSDDASGACSMSITHIGLHKVLVVRVDGGAVPSGDEEQKAENEVLVTLALEAPDAEQLVFALEFGEVWLSLEPEDASEDGTGPVVVTVPDEARNVFE